MWIIVTAAFGWFRKPWWAVAYYAVGLFLSIAMYGRDIPDAMGFFLMSIFINGIFGVIAYLVGMWLGDWRRSVLAKRSGAE